MVQWVGRRTEHRGTPRQVPDVWSWVPKWCRESPPFEFRRCANCIVRPLLFSLWRSARVWRKQIYAIGGIWVALSGYDGPRCIPRFQFSHLLFSAVPIRDCWLDKKHPSIISGTIQLLFDKQQIHCSKKLT